MPKISKRSRRPAYLTRFFSLLKRIGDPVYQYIKPYVVLLRVAVTQTTLAILKSPSPRFSPENIRNGNYCGTVTIDTRRYSFKNTCGFDSLLHGFAAMCDGSDNFRDSARNFQSDFFRLVMNVATDGVDDAVYEDRARLLIANLPSNNAARNNVTTVRCATTVSTLVRRYVTPHLPSVTDQSTCDSPHCSQPTSVVNLAYLPVDLQLIHARDIGALQDALDEGMGSLTSGRACHQTDNRDGQRCGGHVSKTYAVNECAVLIELSSMVTGSASRVHTDIFVEMPLQYLLEDVPSVIRVQERDYRLAFVVEYDSPASDLQLGHYVVHFRRDAAWVCHDDTECHRRSSNLVEHIFPNVLGYVRS